MTEHARDWDAQCERLSAYLDNRLSEAERQALANHIAGCGRCAAEVTELRQVVSLLRAMPAPTLPRSFALPVPERAEAGTASRGEARVGHISTRRRARWADVAQWAGGLAASVGMVLLLGSWLSGVGMHANMYGAASAPAAMTAKQPSATQATQAAPSGIQDGVTPAATPPPAVSSAATPPPATPGPGEQSGNRTFDHTQSQRGGSSGFSLPPVNVPLTGTGLLVAGAATFAVGRGARRRSGRR